MFRDEYVRFWRELRSDVGALVRKANREGLKPAVRLNGTSDLRWEQLPPFHELCITFPGVRFYDYTKWPLSKRWDLPCNYDLTYSRSGEEHHATLSAAFRRSRVAVVFNVRKDEPLPKRWKGHKVVDGDDHDLLFLRPRGCVVGVRAKGRARGSKSPFIVEVS